MKLYPFEYHAIRQSLDVLAPLAAQGVRFWPVQSGELPSANIYLGSPEGAEWLGQNSIRRIARTVGLAWEIAGARLRGRPLQWVRPTQNGNGLGKCGWLLATLLRNAPSGGAQLRNGSGSLVDGMRKMEAALDDSVTNGELEKLRLD